MGKSNYPGKLDTSVEIPPVRNNIVEIGPDVINSIRSAIFQIERVLGINPQGAVGNTVAERLNRLSDGNGNILKSALDTANVLSGPILDSDVSNSAAIRESKLRLDFPTELLQDEISILNGQLDDIITRLDEIAAQFVVHINKNSVNRHPSTAISVAAATTTSSSTASKTLDVSSVQTALENIYTGHINYDGENISSTNNSHTANQIYYDDTNTSAIVAADDVQEAIEELALAALNSQINHQDLFHSNGVLKSGKMDSSDLEGVGGVLASDLVITFSKSVGSTTNTTTVSFSSPPSLGEFILEASDILTISDVDDVDEVFVGSYEIASFTLASGTDLLQSVEIFGLLKASSTASTKGRISKNIKTDTNTASLLVSAREDAGLTSSRAVQICNPNAVRIVSSGIKPSEINVSNRYIDISIDGDTAVNFDIFDNTATKQTVETIISLINEQCADQSLNILAYKTGSNDRGELVIAHNIPDDGSEKHTLSVSRGIDDAIDSLGFSDIEDLTISSNFGTNYFIEGVSYEGLNKKIDSTSLTFLAGSNLVTSSDLNFDFLEQKIKIGDALIVTGAETSSDDGTYIITDITSTQLTLDIAQLPAGFTGTVVDGITRFRIFSNIISLQDIIFEEVAGASGSQVLDLFLDSNGEAFSKKRVEFTPVVSGVTSLLDIVDFKGDIVDKQFSLTVTESGSFIDITIDGGPVSQAYGINSHIWVLSGAENVWFKLYIPNAAALRTKVLNEGDQTVTIYGFDKVNNDSNLLISRVLYGAFNGAASGKPRFTKLLRQGNIGYNEIGSDTKLQLSELPVDDLRANGVIYGLEVINATTVGGYFAFGLTRGVCYVKGKRIEIDPITQIITDIPSGGSIDKFFIVVNESGKLEFEASVSSGTITCISPFADSENASLATIELSGSNIHVIDLRLFVDHLDLKVLNAISVSPTKGMGHFDDINKALSYARRFSELYPKSGRPSIHLKSGTHTIEVEVDESSVTRATWVSNFLAADSGTLERYYDANIESGLVIGIPVNIIGEGDSTIIDIKYNYTFSDTTETYRGNIYIPGDGFTGPATVAFDSLTEGFINFKDFKLDNTRISFLNNSLDDGAGTNFNFGINLDNLIFDCTDFAANTLDDSIDNTYGTTGVFLSNAAQVIGNIKIRDCTFIECLIGMADTGNIKNLEVSGNTVMGDVAVKTEGALFGSDIFHATADYSLIPNQFAPAENNISIFGNISDNTIENGGTDGPKIHRFAFPAITGTGGWGDRFSRDVVVGNNTMVGGNYLYDRVYDSGGGLAAGGKTKTRFFTADYLANTMPAYKSWDPGIVYTLGTLGTGLFSGGSVAVYQVDGGTNIAYFPWPERTVGEVITSVTMGVSANDGFNWIFTIYQHDRNTGAPSIYVSQTAPITSAIASEINEVTFNFSTTTPISSQPYFIAITHDDTGMTYSFAWIEITTKVLSVEEAVGIID